MSRSGLRALGATVAKVASAALGKRGFAEAGVITDWPEIVGPQLAAHSSPVRLAFPRGRRAEGTLHIRVAGAFAVELQHLEPLVVERINRYFGYRAVARLAMVQGPLPERAPRRRHKAEIRRLSDEEERALAERLAAVPEAGLRQALRRLGRAVIGRRPAEPAAGPGGEGPG